MPHDEVYNLIGKAKLWLVPGGNKVQKIIMVNFDRSDIVEMMTSMDDDRYRLHVFTEDIKEPLRDIENDFKGISNIIAPSIRFREMTLDDSCIYMDLLKIAELPKFFVLDSTKIVLRTTQWEEVVDYLKEDEG